MESRELIVCAKCGARRKNESNHNEPCPACLMELGLQAWGNRATGNRATAPFGQLEGSLAAQTAAHSGSFTIEQQGDAVNLGDVFPHLEILHLVGQGGMGAVYCARQKSLDRLVALKIIKPDKQNRAKFEERFVREAKALAQLNHPNIITVHDFGEAGDLYYFVMEYVDGINLRQMLEGQRLTPQQALEIVPAVCDALQYAHDKGIVHRDIKPENILVDTNGNIKIADFGLAKILDSDSTRPALTQAFEVMGTMHYMAPEQIEKPLTVDHRADIYSLGVVFYELLTGELPIGRFAPPSRKIQVDVRLDEIVLQTLEKEPEHRYQKVSDVKSAVDGWADSRANCAPVSPQASVESARRRHPQEAHVQPTSAPLHAPAPPVKQAPWASQQPRVSGYRANRSGPLPRAGFFGSLVHYKTLSNWIYNLLSFPLGLTYFVLTVVFLATGFSLIIVWVGLLLLLLYFVMARGFMGLERFLAITMLNTNIPKVTFPERERKTLWQRTVGLFTSGKTWMGVVFFLGKFPLGVVSFVLSVLSFWLPLSLVAVPVLGLVESDARLFRGDEEFFIVLGSWFGALLLFIPVIHLMNYMAYVHAMWAKWMLSSWARWDYRQH